MPFKHARRLCAFSKCFCVADRYSIYEMSTDLKIVPNIYLILAEKFFCDSIMKYWASIRRAYSVTGDFRC